MEPLPEAAATRNGAKTGRGSSCKEAATEAKEDSGPQETTARNMRRKWGTSDPEEPRWRRRKRHGKVGEHGALKQRCTSRMDGDATPRKRSAMGAMEGAEWEEFWRPW